MGKKSDQVRESFQTFCDGTSMHGFMELFYAKNLCWTVFWVVLLTSAIGLTTYQVIKSINQFMDQQSNTRTTPLSKNDMYPPVKICLQHWIYWVDWDKAFSMNFTKQTVLYGMSYLSTIYTSDLFDMHSAKIQFQATMELNKFTTIQQFYKNVAKPFPVIISSVNLSIAFTEPHIFDAVYRGCLLCYSTPGEAIMQAIDSVEEELNQIFFYIQTLTYATASKYVSFDEYNWYMTNWLTDKSIYYDNQVSQSKNLSFYTLPYLIYVDGYSQNYLPIKEEYDFTQLLVSVEINRWMPNSNYTCLAGQKYINTNRSHCDTCKIIYQDRVCNCMYLGLAVVNDSDYPSVLCQNEIFQIVTGNDGKKNVVSVSNLANQTEMLLNESACTSNLTAKTLQTSCMRNCVDPCEEWNYSFMYMIEKFGTGEIRNYFDKNLSIIRIVYPRDYDIFIMVEVERQTWEDFVANIGGLLGVWTGASILSIVQLVYLCCFSRIDPKFHLGKKSEVIVLDDKVKNNSY